MILDFEKLVARSKNAEVAAIVSRIVTLSSEYDWANDPHLTTMIKDLNALENRFKLALGRDSVLSTLSELDAVRDDYVRDLYYILKGATHNPIDNVRNSGEQLLAIFEKYGLETIHQSYAIESSLLNSLINDLSEKSATDLFKPITGMKEIVALVVKAQEEFETNRVSYEQARAEDVQETASTVKKEALQVLNETIITYLKTMAMINTTVYGKFSETIALMFKENNEQVRKRKKKIPDGTPEQTEKPLD